MALNKAMVIGNVTQDIELKQTPNGNNVVSFSVATNRKWTDSSGTKQEKVEFHNIVAWGKLAELVNNYVVKGSKIYVEGRLETKTWEGEDGKKRYKTEIVLEQIEFLWSKPNGETTSAPATKTATKTAPAPKAEEVSIEDIPF